MKARLQLIALVLTLPMAVFAASYAMQPNASAVDPATTPAGQTDPASPDAIVQLVDAGQFDAAEAAISTALVGLSPADPAREAWLFQRERMRRILLDFTLDASDVLAQLRRQIPDLRQDEFAGWSAAGLIEHRVIDGRTVYFKRAVPNLFRLSAEAAARREDPKPFRDGPMESANAHHISIAETATASGASSVLPRRVRVVQTLTVDKDAVPAGEVLRAWIPFPREIPGQQEEARLLSSDPQGGTPATPRVAQRTVYLEKAAQAGVPTQFRIEYEVTLYGRYHRIDASLVHPADVMPELAANLGERAPHIMFTPALRAFSRDVVGEETNPYRIAQRLFAAVDGIPWAGALEYSTISNISEHAFRTGHADCGQQTLLLMTLLRLNGIPTRWQSGMVFSDSQVGGSALADYWNLHDWGQVYLAPYGWVPMDVTTGRLPGAVDGQGRSLEWFYLGGLDAYRIAFNDDFGTDFEPAKQHFRSDTVDSQRGEVEWRGGNLYFDQWTYDFTSEVLRR